MVQADGEMGSSWHIGEEDDLSEGVQAAAARKLQYQPIITLSTTDEESDADAVEHQRWHHKPLKFGKPSMADVMVLRRLLGLMS